jgi:hypothetical protein
MGVTGSGKSRLLQAMFLQLLRQRVGVSLIDPHHDLAEGILTTLVETGFFDRSAAFERLIYFDFARPEPIPFNPLRSVGRSQDVAYALVEAVKRAWPSIAGGTAPLLENVLLASTAALVEAGEPITSLQPLLTDEEERRRILHRVRDPGTAAFFRERFAAWGQRGPFLAESTLRRLFLLTFAPELRGPLGHVENVVEFGRFMQEGRGVIYDLGRVRNPEARRLLGCLVAVGYELAATNRAATTAGRRRQHHLILDEFGEFVAQSGRAMDQMLATSRKFGLSLTLAHQTWSQTSQQLRGSLQNCGVRVLFRLGHGDAQLMSSQVAAAGGDGLADRVWSERLQRLQQRRAFVIRGGRALTELETVWMPNAEAEHRLVSRVARRYVELYHAAEAVSRPVPDGPERTSEPVGERFRRFWT